MILPYDDLKYTVVSFVCRTHSYYEIKLRIIFRLSAIDSYGVDIKLDLESYTMTFKPFVLKMMLINKKLKLNP
jgi:hypothetical protein